MIEEKTYGNHYEHMAACGCLCRGERDLFQGGWYWRVHWREAKRLVRQGWRISYH